MTYQTRSFLMRTLVTLFLIVNINEDDMNMFNDTVATYSPRYQPSDTVTMLLNSNRRKDAEIEEQQEKINRLQAMEQEVVEEVDVSEFEDRIDEQARRIEELEAELEAKEAELEAKEAELQDKAYELKACGDRTWVKGFTLDDELDSGYCDKARHEIGEYNVEIGSCEQQARQYDGVVKALKKELATSQRLATVCTTDLNARKMKEKKERNAEKKDVFAGATVVRNDDGSIEYYYTHEEDYDILSWFGW